MERLTTPLSFEGALETDFYAVSAIHGIKTDDDKAALSNSFEQGTEQAFTNGIPSSSVGIYSGTLAMMFDGNINTQAYTNPGAIPARF